MEEVMEIEIIHGSILTVEADTLVVNLFEGVRAPAGATGAVDQALDGAIRELIESGDLSGKSGPIASV
jgi:leucyl aminopeptidase